MSLTESTSFQEQLDAVGRRGELPPGAQAVMARTFAHIARVAPGLAPGERAPDFTLPDQLGRPVSLAQVRARGPVVLVFYRGAWCPYCNVLLSAMNATAPEIKALGASLIAVTPQAPERTVSLAEKHALAFPVLTDADQAVIAAYRLGYTTPLEQQELVRAAFGLDLARENANGTWQLPATATYVIDAGGVIAEAGVTAEPNERMDPESVLSALRALG